MFFIRKLNNIKVNESRRNLWQWLNIIFNSVDEDRRKLYGPDRACAEWVLRNGGAIKWTTASEYLNDYNKLPPEEFKLHIKEIDATDSSISHYGFPHLVGCEHINKITLHKCNYLQNAALPLLKPISDTLTHLQVSSCGNITEEGLNSLTVLHKLENLIIFDLPYIKNKEKILKSLVTQLPKCNITFK